MVKYDIPCKTHLRDLNKTIKLLDQARRILGKYYTEYSDALLKVEEEIFKEKIYIVNNKTW